MAVDEPSIEPSRSSTAVAVEEAPVLGGHETAINSESVAFSSKKERSKISQPSTWKKNIRKIRRNNGLSYVASSGKFVDGRVMKRGCDKTKCKIKCANKIDEEQRNNIFTKYWALGDITMQRSFLAAHTKKRPVNSRKETSKRRNNIEYVLLSKDGSLERVCKLFFLDTLGINTQIVKTAMLKVSSAGTVGFDNRNKGKNRLPDSIRNDVREHIRQFPTVEAHYCRKDSTKQYLPDGLKRPEMYRMYKEECLQQNKDCAKPWLYNKTLKLDFNLGFFKPKKDQCDQCLKYDKLTAAEQQELKEEIDHHMLRKRLSREAKENAKKEAIANSQSVCAACFDLQKVLTTPKSMSSQLYYLRKLATYNLTVFDMASKAGNCYMWHEGIAKRGATNIASCLYKFLCDHSDVKEFKFFTDNCGGQNKNKTMVAMYIHVARTMNVKITHYFLERGHTQNEGDSVHAAIERVTANMDIFAPQQWYSVVRRAKQKGYNVVEMGEHMLNLDQVVAHYNVLSVKPVGGGKIEWTKIHILHFDCEQPNKFFFAYEYDEDLREASVMKLEDGVEVPIQTFGDIPSLPLQSSVTAAKKKDLLKMCKELIIPRDYHSFYDNLVIGTEQNEDENEMPAGTAPADGSMLLQENETTSTPQTSNAGNLRQTQRKRSGKRTNIGDSSTKSTPQTCDAGLSTLPAFSKNGGSKKRLQILL